MDRESKTVTEKKMDRDTETGTEREIDRYRGRHRVRERDRERGGAEIVRQKQGKRERWTETERQMDRDKKREKEMDRDKDRGREMGRDRDIEKIEAGRKKTVRQKTSRTEPERIIRRYSIQIVCMCVFVCECVLHYLSVSCSVVNAVFSRILNLTFCPCLTGRDGVMISTFWSSFTLVPFFLLSPEVRDTIPIRCKSPTPFPRSLTPVHSPFLPSAGHRE